MKQSPWMIVILFSFFVLQAAARSPPPGEGSLPLEIYLKLLIDQSGSACRQVKILKDCYLIGEGQCENGFKSATTQCASEMVKDKGVQTKVDEKNRSQLARELGRCSMELFQAAQAPAFKKNDPKCAKAKGPLKSNRQVLGAGSFWPAR